MLAAILGCIISGDDDKRVRQVSISSHRVIRQPTELTASWHTTCIIRKWQAWCSPFAVSVNRASPRNHLAFLPNPGKPGVCGYPQTPFSWHCTDEFAKCSGGWPIEWCFRLFSNDRRGWNHGHEESPTGNADPHSYLSECRVAARIGRERQQRRIEPR